MESRAADRPGRRQELTRRIVAAATSTLLAFVGVEALLAFRIAPLSETASRYTYGCYERTQPKSYIHSTVLPLRVGIHRPDFEADCFFLGYTWRHRSDGYGWRNPQTWEEADVVLLGDSMVYGHGVEEEQTTARFLRDRLGRVVVNMGVTGGSPVHYLAHTRNFALPLRPRVVVVLFFSNDLQDIRAYRSEEEIENFVRSGEGPETLVLPRSDLLDRLRPPRRRRLAVLHRLATWRFFDYIVRERRGRRVLRRGGELPPEVDPETRPRAAPPPDAVLERMEGRLTVAYLRRATAMMAASTREADAALVVGVLGRRSSVDYLLRRVLRDAALEPGVHYFDVPVLEGRNLLPYDGHLSEEGHRYLAALLATYLEGERLLGREG